MQILRYNVIRGIMWFMKKLFSLLTLTLIVFQYLQAADKGKMITTNTDFCSLPTELQADTLKHIDLDTKLNILTFNIQRLLFLCLDIKQLDSLLPDITKPEVELENFYQDMNKALDVIDAHTYISAWENDTVQYKELVRINTLKKQVINTAQELDSLLDRLKELLPQYMEANINIHTDINIEKIEVLKEKISLIMRIEPLFPISSLNLSSTTFNDKEKWIPLIQRLPATLKRIDLHQTNISTSGLLELNKFKNLEVLNLYRIQLSTQEDWGLIIQTLPETLKRIELRDTNIDSDALVKLNRLNNLELIHLWNVKLPNQEDWVAVIHALPEAVIRAYLFHTNIDASGLIGLNRLKNLEEGILGHISLSNQKDWIPVIQALPAAITRLDLNETNIDASALVKLNRLKHLEDINLYRVQLSNQKDWAPVIQALPAAVTMLDLSETNIGVSGLMELSKLKHLEEINLYRVQLSNQKHWTPVILSLQETVKKLTLFGSNCPNNCMEYLKSKGIDIDS